MDEKVWQRQRILPVGVRRDTRKPMSLQEAIEDEAALASPADMSVAERISTVRARWLAGEWQDTIYGTEGHFDLNRAIRELEAQTPAGRDLLQVAEVAIAMAREQARSRRR